MEKPLSKVAGAALAATDWSKVDAMTDEDLARQIAANPDAAPDMAPEIDVHAIRHAAGMTQAQFADTYEFCIRTVQEWERGAKKAKWSGQDAVARHQGRSRRSTKSPRSSVASWTCPDSVEAYGAVWRTTADDNEHNVYAVALGIPECICLPSLTHEYLSPIVYR
jgi:putative transcriptional regulator